MSNICYSDNEPVGHYDTHHTRDVMNAKFASKSSASITSFEPNFKCHQASFQAYKTDNEDRTAVLKTDYGCILGVFDGTHASTPRSLKIPTTVSGHYDDLVSEYASKNLIKEVDVQISAVIAKNPNVLDAIPICLVNTIEKFDATLHSNMIEKMHEMDPKPWSEWTNEDIPDFLGMKEMGEHDPYPIMRRACAGTTVLIAVIIEHNVWVASLGDSEGCESTSFSIE